MDNPCKFCDKKGKCTTPCEKANNFWNSISSSMNHILNAIDKEAGNNEPKGNN